MQSSLNTLRHVYKLDPNKPLTTEQVQKLVMAQTDAFIVGGTDGITYEKTEQLLKILQNFNLPKILEVTAIEAIIPGFDFYFIPLVLNAQNPKLIFAKHVEALKMYGNFIPWEKVFVVGYIVLNQDAKVAKLTKSKMISKKSELIAYARLIDQLLKLPILYLEYSGKLGDLEAVKEVKAVLTQAQLFYGGGITNEKTAGEFAEYADTIVVGNVIYDDFAKALTTINKQR